MHCFAEISMDEAHRQPQSTPTPGARHQRVTMPAGHYGGVNATDG